MEVGRGPPPGVVYDESVLAARTAVLGHRPLVTQSVLCSHPQWVNTGVRRNI